MHLVFRPHSGSSSADEPWMYRSGRELNIPSSLLALGFDACVCMYSILANRSWERGLTGMRMLR